jgi:hypothetical protein
MRRADCLQRVMLGALKPLSLHESKRTGWKLCGARNDDARSGDLSTETRAAGRADAKWPRFSRLVKRLFCERVIACGTVAMFVAVPGTYCWWQGWRAVLGPVAKAPYARRLGSGLRLAA